MEERRDDSTTPTVSEGYDALAEEGDDLDRDPRLKESGGKRTEDTVTCEECEAQVPREDAINLGGAMGLDVWTCEGKHVGLNGGEDGE